MSTDDNLPNIAANRNIEPAKLAKSLRGELDWVVMKALEKDRTRRYDTANGLARDIQRHLMDEVVEARPPSRGYRLKKFVRRHKGQVLAAGMVLFALLGGLGASFWQMGRAVTAEGQSKINAEEARENERQAIANAQHAITERDAKAKALEAEAALVQAENNLSLQRILQAEQHWQNGNLI